MILLNENGYFLKHFSLKKLTTISSHLQINKANAYESLLTRAKVTLSQDFK
jgi:hypothetical protein